MPFKKGQSGNPRGRTPGLPNAPALDARQWAQALLPKVRQVLTDLLDSDDDSVKLRASEIVLNRALGKVPQPITGTEDGKPVRFVVNWLPPQPKPKP